MKHATSISQILALLFVLGSYAPLVTAAASPARQGEFLGAMDTEYPAWFKDSFLDLKEDVAEATEAGKRLVLFFYQNGCPYCNALVERNFAQKDIKEKAQKNFDIIAINMWGNRTVTNVDGDQYIEKTLASSLKVQFTPTVLFFNEKGKVVLRINGYHSPQRFNIDLDYVALHKETELSYRDYVKANRPTVIASKKLNKQDYFSKGPFNFSKKARKNKTRPFAVFFEQKDCPDCDLLHSKVLPDNDLKQIIKQFDVTQLNMWSKTPVVTPSGKNMTAKEWAKELNIQFAPSIVVFNPEGEEVIRSEAFFKVFHTQGIFNYVLSEGYKKEPSFQRYLTEYAEHFRESGSNVNIWRYANEKQ
ncbi:MAG: thioredoxin fold domain-containing protein [Gammaproteobacteria bacterium]|nr:thioredoxin fold domain-containing protein [Gammaproteobacteria bacterium]